MGKIGRASDYQSDTNGMKLVTQSILPFKLKTTHERITSAAHNLEFIKDYEAQTLPSKFFECPYVGHLPYL